MQRAQTGFVENRSPSFSSSQPLPRGASAAGAPGRKDIVSPASNPSSPLSRDPS